MFQLWANEDSLVSSDPSNGVLAQACSLVLPFVSLVPSCDQPNDSAKAQVEEVLLATALQILSKPTYLCRQWMNHPFEENLEPQTRMVLGVSQVLPQQNNLELPLQKSHL